MQQTIQAALKGKIGARDIASVAYDMAGSGLRKSGDSALVGFPSAELFPMLAAQLQSCQNFRANYARVNTSILIF